MLLYAHTITPRLSYIAQWLEEHYLNERLELTDSQERFCSYEGPRINYSVKQITEQECWIEPAGLLWEDKIQPQSIQVSTLDGSPVFFTGSGQMGFDPLAASFYLITRYEEYLPGGKDPFGRFDHKQSLAFRNNFLDRPLIDEWMQALCGCLRTRYPSLKFKEQRFELLTTYDIDESYAYLFKPIWVQTAGIFRDLLRGRFSWIQERIRTLTGKQQDPYDAFAFLSELHASIHTTPLCFIHVAAKKGPRDKNLSPQHPEQKRLVQSLSRWAHIGLHPSWQTGDEPSLLRSEKESLEKIISHSVLQSRQHFIRFQLPSTYRQLIKSGITDDYSMGYGSINGFRASTARSFYWFDLEKNHCTPLRVHPFCYMEATSFFETQSSIELAENEWRSFEQAVRSVNGRMITIWHNTTLGTQKRFQGWRDRYAYWLREIID